MTVNDPIARVTFSIEDIREIAEGEEGPTVTDLQLRAWLHTNRQHIEEARVRAGWEAIDTLLSMEQP